MRLRLATVYCTDVTKILAKNFTCTHKLLRGGHGIVSIIYDPKEVMEELWIAIKLDFKPRLALIFRPWQLAGEFDWCERMKKGGTTNLFFDTVIDYGLKKHAPSIFVQCPFTGERGAYNMDFASILESALPQIFPTGTYKVSIRLFRKSSNVTYLTVWAIFELKAADFTKDWEFGK